MTRRAQLPLFGDAWGGFVGDDRRKMLRVLLYVTLLAGLFVGAVLGAGNALGAFEPVNVPLHAPGGASTDTGKSQKPDKKQHKDHKKR
jgi:hypothetical protein